MSELERRSPQPPAVYTGPLTEAQAQWLAQVARERQPDAPAPIIIQVPAPSSEAPPAAPRADWTMVILAAIAGFVVLAVVSAIAVSCANTPPPAPIHKSNPNCMVGCF